MSGDPFQPRACRERRARTKGKDERMVRYIKENCFVRYREFENLTHLNQLAEQWLREEADQRLHGERSRKWSPSVSCASGRICRP